MPKLLRAAEGHPTSLTEVELDGAAHEPATRGRFPRLPQFHGCKIDAQAALLRLKIMSVGVGSVGRNAALHVARLQPHTQWLIDPKTYTSASLATQPIEPRDIGRPKARVTAVLCKGISPWTRVFYCEGPAQALALDDFARADLILMAGDNLALEVFLGQVCLNLGKPLLQASVHGPTLVCQVRFWANNPAEGPCPACAFSAAEWAALNAATPFSCAGLRSDQAAPSFVGPFTMSVSALGSLAADLLVTQLLRWRLRLGMSVQDSLVEHCGYTHRSVIQPLKRNPACPCDHSRFAVKFSSRQLSHCSLAKLAAAAGLGMRDAASFAIPGMQFVERGACKCLEPRLVMRFASPREIEFSLCPTCREPIRLHRFYARPAAPTGVLGPLLDRPLRELCATPVRSVLVRGTTNAVLFLNEPPIDQQQT
jgi:molybdopterin/thiamine biosynthesis adenylyltransferase